jgi:membrane-associated protease RseP (regulator of RpoE activity)
MEERQAPTRWWLHGLLLALTFGSTLYWGFHLTDKVPEGVDPWASAEGWTAGLFYAVSILAILFTHEMGHYLTARRYGVEATPPYFLPGFPPFGTFGAFIKMQIGQISARELFRIGAGGPYAGFVVALPVLLVGLGLSEVRPLPPEFEESWRLGDSLLMMGLTRAWFGAVAEGHDVFLHPMAYAGWVGMFVTSFNLVPLGQLDGGHVAYTLFGERFNRAAPWLLAGLVALGATVFTGWLVLVAFLWFTGFRHPAVVARGEVVRGVDRALAWGALVMFALTFVPRPFGTATLLDLLLELVAP